jgi:hypothetical protein
VETATAREDWESLVQAIDERRIDPYSAAAQLVRHVTGRGPAPGEGGDR